jgi:diguanylate cyclase (GGDEF)-like protein
LSSILVYRSVLITGVSGTIGIFGWFARRYYERLDRSSHESRRTLQRQRALAQVTTALTSELDHDRVIALVLRSAVDILGVAAGYVAVRGDDGQSRIAEVQNLPRALRGREVSPDGRRPPDSEIAAATAKYLGSATAPIIINGTPQGALTIFRSDTAAMSAEEQEQLDNLAEVASVAIANARLFAERQRKESHLQILNTVGRVLAETLDLNAAVETVRTELSKAMTVDAFFVATYDEAVSEVTIIHLWDDGQLYPPSTFPLEEGITGKAITTKKSVRINIYRDEDDPPGTVWVGNDDRKTQSIIVVPMLREDRVVGALSAQSYRPDAYDAEHEQLVQTVANSVAVALENQRLYEQLRRLSLQDWMTGLGNAHYFYQEMEREIARAERYRHPLSLIMIDSDLLKEINDEFGHAVGDQHVVEVADIIRSETRQADVAIRYAGDEFLVILPETDASSAMVTAERIRQRVERTPLAVNRRNVPVTVSVGVAAYPEHGRDADELFRNVDAALYEAKRAGKNRSSLCAALLKGDGPMPLV